MAALARNLSRCCALVALVAAGSEARSVARSMRGKDTPAPAKQDLYPPLKAHPETKEPQHNEQYYAHDYPHDEQPKPLRNLKFDHPYPEVQVEDEFDIDYPKDENSDDGEWQAQLDYDTRRAELYKRRKEAAKAKKLLDESQKALEDLRRFDETGAQQVKDAEDRLNDAKQAWEAAKEELKRLGQDSHREGETIHNGTAAHAPWNKLDEELQQAIDEVARAAEHLDDCEEQLQRAMEALEDRLDDMDEEQRERAHRALGKASEALGQHSHLNETQTVSSRAELERSRAQQNLESLEREHAEAVARLEKATAERKAQEKVTKEAADKLRTYRRKVPESLKAKKNKEPHGVWPLSGPEDSPITGGTQKDEEEAAPAHSGARRSAGVLLALVAAAMAPMAA